MKSPEQFCPVCHFTFRGPFRSHILHRCVKRPKARRHCINLWLKLRRQVSNQTRNRLKTTLDEAKAVAALNQSRRSLHKRSSPDLTMEKLVSKAFDAIDQHAAFDPHNFKPAPHITLITERGVFPPQNAEVQFTEVLKSGCSHIHYDGRRNPATDRPLVGSEPLVRTIRSVPEVELLPQAKLRQVNSNPPYRIQVERDNTSVLNHSRRS